MSHQEQPFKDGTVIKAGGVRVLYFLLWNELFIWVYSLKLLLFVPCVYITEQCKLLSIGMKCS